MKVSVIKKALALALAVVTAGALGCSSESGSTGASSSGGEEQAGTATMDLRIGRTTQINKVNFTLTGPGGFSRTGSIDVSHDREAEGSIPNVPVGSPYTLSVNASSTDGNVTCTGSKSGINVTCPGNRERDEKVVKLTCTRNHLGIEWGDKDWRSNARTFFITAEFKLICAKTDAGVDSGSDTGAEACVPKTCAGSNVICGPLADGCGHTLQCGTCPSGQTCTSAGQCVCQPATTCPAGQNCGTAP